MAVEITRRTLTSPLTTQAVTKRFESDCYVEGYATTFNTPYVLFEFEDGEKIYERIDAHALDGADMTDVVMLYNHEGRIFARQSNNTLLLECDSKGLFIAADLSRTDLAKSLYQDIEARMITKMSWAFIISEQEYDKAARTINIMKIKKVVDVSAVSSPANDKTEISARNAAQAYLDYETQKKAELIKRARLAEIKSML